MGPHSGNHGSSNSRGNGGQTAAALANMSTRGQESFARAAAQQGLASPLASSSAGRSGAGNFRPGPSASTTVANEGFGRSNQSSPRSGAQQSRRSSRSPRRRGIRSLLGLNSRSPAQGQMVVYGESSERGESSRRSRSRGSRRSSTRSPSRAGSRRDGDSRRSGSRATENNQLVPWEEGRNSTRNPRIDQAGALGAIAEESTGQAPVNLNFVVLNNTQQAPAPQNDVVYPGWWVWPVYRRRHRRIYWGDYDDYDYYD